MSAAEADFEAALDALLRRRFGRGLGGQRRLSGGASQETYAVDLAGEGAADPLILRRRPGGLEASRDRLALSLDSEARLLELAGSAEVPVPGVRALLEPGDALGSGYLMERLEGETLPRRILRDERFDAVRPHLARQCGGILARIHAIPARELPAALATADAEAQWKHYRELYDGFGEPHPVFELAFRWLEARRPAPCEPVLVHGDFRHGNLLIGEAGVRGVLDWELAHRGDPCEDLGWLCVRSWRFGSLDLPVGGFGRREELLAGYAAAGGGDVDPERVHYWEVLGTLKWGIMCGIMRSVFESGADASVERAAIGRRASETELDLLDLIAGEG